MPSHSAKQHRFMEAIAHSPSFAKKAGVPQSVGKEFAAADKGKTFKKGGEMKESKAMIKKEVAFMKAKGAPKSMIKHEEAEAKGYRRGGRIKRYDEGGISEGPNKNIDDDTRARALAWAARGGQDEEVFPAARPAAPRARPAAARPAMTRVTEVETARVPQAAPSNARKDEEGPYRGRAMSYKGRQSPERQQQNAENVASAAKVAASMIPLGRIANAIRGGVGLLDRAMTRREETRQAAPKLDEMMERARERFAEQGARGGRELGTEGLGLEEAARLSPEALRNRRMIAEVPVGTTRRDPILEEAQRRAIRGGFVEANPFEGMKHSSQMSTEELLDRARSTRDGYKRGGNVKETMGPMDMREDVEGGEHAQHMRFGEHSEQHRGHTRGINLGDSGSNVGIEGGGKMKASHIKHIMTMAAGGLTAPQIAKIMSGMQRPAPAARGMAPGMPQGVRAKRMAVGGISAQPTAMPQMQQRPQQNMMNMRAQVPPAAQGGQFAMQQAQHPQMGGINPHPQMGVPQPTGSGGGINPHPQMGGPQPTGSGGGINPQPKINNPTTPVIPSGYPGGAPLAIQPTGSGGDFNLNSVITGYGPNGEPIYSQQDQFGHQITATGPYTPTTQPQYAAGGGVRPQPQGPQQGTGSDGGTWIAAAGGVAKKLPTAKQMGAMALAKGGRVKETMGPRSMKEDVERGSNRHLKHGESAVQKKGHTKGKNLGDSGKTVGIERGPKHFAKGGHVKSIDGIARRGHTKVKYR